MKYVFVPLAVIITSLFFFPFEFVFLRGVNTKMILAVFGISIFLLTCAKKKEFVVSKEFFVASIIAGLFSFIGFYSVTYNNTNDYDYATYVISMWVWLGAAYAVCSIINWMHNSISVKLIINYLIAVCVLQCILALLIDNISSFKFFVDSFTVDGEFIDNIDRLYGIGAALDVAGIRFSAVLVMIALLLCKDQAIRSSRWAVALYIFLFVIISVVGSMIARTTNVGMVVAFVYLVYATEVPKMRIKYTNLKLWGVLFGVVLVLVLVCVYLYNNIPEIHRLLRFAFEGFINWVETGKWETSSTNKLQTMWVFPETLKTWIIGDGYFMDPTTHGTFYMKTDVGYLRFIFYCGTIGLCVFLSFFLYLSIACYKKFPKEKELFLLLFVLVLVIWIKVSTDIFLVYALFLCIPRIQQQNRISIKGS
jgi:hypothetical protein